MLDSSFIMLSITFLSSLRFNQRLRTKCEEVDSFKKRRECYEAGQSVTFLAGGYYFCCYNLTHEQLVSIGASAFWTREVGFCGRGACEVCSKKQECVVFSDDDIFCCPRGYSKYHLKLEHENQEREEKAKKEGHELNPDDNDDGEELDEEEIDDMKMNEDRESRKKKMEMMKMEKEVNENEDDLLEDT